MHKINNSCAIDKRISGLYCNTNNMRVWDIEKRDLNTSAKINAICRILSKTEQSYSEKYNKRKVVIKITGLNPLWLFLLRRGMLCRMSPMCLCQWCVVSNCFLIVFRGCNGRQLELMERLELFV